MALIRSDFLIDAAGSQAHFGQVLGQSETTMFFPDSLLVGWPKMGLLALSLSGQFLWNFLDWVKPENSDCRNLCARPSGASRALD